MPILDQTGERWLTLGRDGKPITQEIASIHLDIHRVFYGRTLRNEDDTLLTRGGAKGLKIYQELKRDAHAGAILAKRKLAVTSRPWQVNPASDKRVDKKAAELVERAFKRLRFNSMRKRLLEATLVGYAVSEVMWEVVDGLVLPARVVARDPRRFVFGIEGELRLRTPSNMVDGEAMPERKFIVHRRGADDDSPYGTGVGGMLFWPVFFKRNTITFWLTFADKFGNPTPIGRYPNGDDGTLRTKLLAAMQAISQETGIAIPEGTVIELLEAQRTGSVDTYDRLVRYMDEQMSKAVLGETMSTTAAPTGLGSNQASVQNEVRLEVAQDDADELDETINDTLVKWIVEFNMPGAGLPELQTVFDEPEDQTAMATRDKTLWDMGWELTPEAVEEKYGPGYVKKAPAPNPFAMLQPDGLGGFVAPGAEDPQDLEDPAAANDEEAPAFAEGRPLQQARGANRARQQAIAEGARAQAAQWERVLGPRVRTLQSMLDETGDLLAFREQLDTLLTAPPDPGAVDAIARPTFAANVMGRGQASQRQSLLQRLLGRVLSRR